MPSEIAQLLGILGGFGGVAALITALLTGRAVARKAHGDALKSSAEAVAVLSSSMTDALARLENETGELRKHVDALEIELADSRRSVLEMTDALSELTGRIDAALDLLDTTRDPAAEAAAKVLKKPRRPRKTAAKK
jgi:hypothetical protein